MSHPPPDTSPSFIKRSLAAVSKVAHRDRTSEHRRRQRPNLSHRLVQPLLSRLHAQGPSLPGTRTHIRVPQTVYPDGSTSLSEEESTYNQADVFDALHAQSHENDLDIDPSAVSPYLASRLPSIFRSSDAPPPLRFFAPSILYPSNNSLQPLRIAPQEHRYPALTSIRTRFEPPNGPFTRGGSSPSPISTFQNDGHHLPAATFFAPPEPQSPSPMPLRSSIRTLRSSLTPDDVAVASPYSTPVNSVSELGQDDVYITPSASITDFVATTARESMDPLSDPIHAQLQLFCDMDEGLVDDASFPGTDRSIWATCPTPPPSPGRVTQTLARRTSHALLNYLVLECGYDLASLRNLVARSPGPRPEPEDVPPTRATTQHDAEGAATLSPALDFSADRRESTQVDTILSEFQELLASEYLQGHQGIDSAGSEHLSAIKFEVNDMFSEDSKNCLLEEAVDEDRTVDTESGYLTAVELSNTTFAVDDTQKLVKEGTAAGNVRAIIQCSAPALLSDVFSVLEEALAAESIQDNAIESQNPSLVEPNVEEALLSMDEYAVPLEETSGYSESTDHVDNISFDLGLAVDAPAVLFSSEHAVVHHLQSPLSVLEDSSAIGRVKEIAVDALECSEPAPTFFEPMAAPAEAEDFDNYELEYLDEDESSAPGAGTRNIDANIHGPAAVVQLDSVFNVGPTVDAEASSPFVPTGVHAQRSGILFPSRYAPPLVRRRSLPECWMVSIFTLLERQISPPSSPTPAPRRPSEVAERKPTSSPAQSDADLPSLRDEPDIRPEPVVGVQPQIQVARPQKHTFTHTPSYESLQTPTQSGHSYNREHQSTMPKIKQKTRLAEPQPVAGRPPGVPFKWTSTGTSLTQTKKSTLMQRLRGKKRQDVEDANDSKAEKPLAERWRQRVSAMSKSAVDRLREILRLDLGSRDLQWDEFVKMMLAMGFRVEQSPRGRGRSVKFIPPFAGLPVIAFSRPSDGECHKALYSLIRKTLKKVYGWDADIFS